MLLVMSYVLLRMKVMFVDTLTREAPLSTISKSQTKVSAKLETATTTFCTAKNKRLLEIIT